MSTIEFTDLKSLILQFSDSYIKDHSIECTGFNNDSITFKLEGGWRLKFKLEHNNVVILFFKEYASSIKSYYTLRKDKVCYAHVHKMIEKAFIEDIKKTISNG